MSSNSAIEWTDTTWNPVSGCTRVSAGCDNCYAVTMTHRLEGMGQEKYAGLTVLNKRGQRHFNGVVKTHEDALSIPLKWRKPRKVFVNSMSDLFHKDVPEAFIVKCFAVMRACPQHTFQILTKRPERMASIVGMEEFGCYVDAEQEALADRNGWCHAHQDDPWPSRNIWLGTSVENQEQADIRIPHLLRCPAAVRFLSCEPLIEGIDFYTCSDRWYARGYAPWRNCPILTDIHWVIVGGESGKGARPCDIAWIRSIVDQCRQAGVSCFVKQLGKRPVEYAEIAGANSIVMLKDPKGGDMAEWPEDLRVRQFPTTPAADSKGAE